MYFALLHVLFNKKKTAHMNTLLEFGMFSLTDGFDGFFFKFEIGSSQGLPFRICPD